MPAGDNSTRSRTHRLRAAVQIVCLGAFVYLALAMRLNWWSPVPGDLFLRFDPLVWLAGSVAARQWAIHGAFVLALVVATLLLGRVFCGWMCPVGTLLDTFRFVLPGNRGGNLVTQGSGLRFWILAALIVVAIAGVNVSGWLDPLVIAARAAHATPRASATAAAIAWGTVVAVVALVALRPRFWCRTLCPLGALLSVVSAAVLYRRRVAGTCTTCGTCGDVCPTGQSVERHSTTDCIVCRRCQAACPSGAITFAFATPSPGRETRGASASAVDRRRGWLLGTSGLVLAGLAGWLTARRPVRAALRPPGTGTEERFLARCVGCGTCLVKCPTAGLVPVLASTRLDALLTPQLVPRLGACLPECTACGDACFTGAIRRLTAADKVHERIGLAVIDRSRCWPWGTGERCVICVDACPSDYAAIVLQRIRPGTFRPVVDSSRCTGCGICEFRCPVDGAAAIRVVAASSLEAEWEYLVTGRAVGAGHPGVWCSDFGTTTMDTGRGR